MKVFFPIITNFSGADIYFERLAAGLADQGWQPDLRRYPHIMEFLPYTALQPFLRPNRDCALVHTKAEYGWLFAVPQRPLVVTLAHSVFDPAYAGSKGLGKRLYHNLKLKGNIARSFARADRIVTVSHFSARSIAECFGRDDIRVIHNGVDESLFRPPTDNALRRDPPHRLLFVGNCTARKGFDLLPRILDRLGKGFILEYTSGLRTRASRPPHPAMRCLGQLRGAELVQAYQRSDIFLFPSRLEGFGYPVAEAMACGKPVVCTNYSSLPELVDDGRGGTLCPRDDVDAFAEGIRRLARDPDLRAQMGAYNRAKVEERFTLSRCVQRYVELYAELA